MSDDCSFSARLQQRVMTEEDWVARHDVHLLGFNRPRFTREEFPHPSGAWFWLVCPCGAKHLTFDKHKS